MEETAEERIKKLGIVLPPPPLPAANYVTFVIAGHMLYLAGQGPIVNGQPQTGTVGADVTVDEAYQHARISGLNLLSVANSALGTLNRVKRVVHVFGLVRATPDFTNHPQVVNGVSDLFNEVFGDRGKHARSAVGAGSLPMGITVEVECVMEIEPH